MDLVDLVEVPARFKDELAKRFNPKRAVKEKGVWFVKASCAPCDYYRGRGDYCGDCPLREYEKDDSPNFFSGCYIWLQQVMKDLGEDQICFGLFPDCVAWNASDDAAARRQLAKLRIAVLKQKKYIKWV